MKSIWTQTTKIPGRNPLPGNKKTEVAVIGAGLFGILAAHYLKEQLEQAGLTARYDREFFHEFVTEGDTDSGLILKALEEKGILGGLPLNDREILWCATEQNRKEDIDQAAQIVKEVCGE